MSKNISDQILEEKLINDVKELKTQVRELRTKQPLVGDVAKFTVTPIVVAISVEPLNANTQVTVRIEHTVSSLTVMKVFNIETDLYVGEEDAFDHLWNSVDGGSALTVGEKKVDLWNLIGRRVLSERGNEVDLSWQLFNFDSSGHNYYLKYTINLLKES